VDVQQRESTYRSKGYERISYWRVYCSADCGHYLAGSGDSWVYTTVAERAAAFPDADKAWQGAMAAGPRRTRARPLRSDAAHVLLRSERCRRLRGGPGL
jgi:hypothetical protein